MQQQCMLARLVRFSGYTALTHGTGGDRAEYEPNLAHTPAVRNAPPELEKQSARHGVKP